MKKVYGYYMTQRPPMPGAMPTDGLEIIDEEPKRRFINAIGCDAYARLMYSRELTQEEVNQYELVPLFYDVQLTRTEILRIMELLREKVMNDSSLYEPLNETWSKLKNALNER